MKSTSIYKGPTSFDRANRNLNNTLFDGKNWLPLQSNKTQIRKKLSQNNAFGSFHQSRNTISPDPENS